MSMNGGLVLYFGPVTTWQHIQDDIVESNGKVSRSSSSKYVFISLPAHLGTNSFVLDGLCGC